MGSGAGGASFVAVRALVAPVFVFSLGMAGCGRGPVGLLAALSLLLLWVWRRVEAGGFLALLGACFCAGAALHAQAQVHPARPAAWADGAEPVLEGVVESVGPSPGAAHLAVTRWQAEPGAPWEAVREVVAVSGAPASALPGERVRTLAKLFAPRPPANEGESDGPERDLESGVDVRGVVVAWLPVEAAPAWQQAAARFRAAFDAEAALAIPDPAARGLVEALAVGDRAGLDAETNERFNASGLAHLISVSGLHISGVALALAWLLEQLLRCIPHLLRRGLWRAGAGVLALPWVWGYVGLTGAEVPAVRCGWMATVLLLSRLVGRQADGPSSLALAAGLVLTVDPLALHDLSFQLSFLAVLGLMALTSPLRALIPLARPDAEAGWAMKGRELVLLSACSSLAASLATAPLLAAAFHRESLVGVLANAAALPLASVLTVGCAAGAAVVPFPALLRVVLTVLGPLSQLVVGLARAFGALSWAQVRLGAFDPATLVLYGLFLVGLWGVGRALWSRRLLLGSVGALLLLGGFKQVGPALRDELEVTFLSVGQGDATFVRFPDGHTLLIDGGGEVGHKSNPGDRVILPFLFSRGIASLDAVALTHPHPDHALGLIAVGDKVRASELWTAAGTDEGGFLRQLVQAYPGALRRVRAAGERGPDWGGVKVEVLGPPKDARFEKVNDQSLILKLTYGEVSFLLMGDAEAEAEQALLASGADVRATVLKAPHHGSQTSSSEALVRAVKPGHVVFCVGEHNRFGFPHERVQGRYQALGCHLLRTDRDGQITFRTDGHALDVKTFR